MDQNEPSQAPAAEPVEERLADILKAREGPVASHVGSVLGQLGELDRAIYTAIAVTPTPDLDGPLRRLSLLADNSRLWLGIAAGLAVFRGPTGRRAAAPGPLSVGVTPAAANTGSKSAYRRRRPGRAGAGVPEERHVEMPSSRSFPSGHSASGFAFAGSVGQDLPVLALPLRFLAGAVAYSRVHTGVHYPGDAVIGSIIGASVALAISGLTENAVDTAWRRKPLLRKG